ncbi:MAG: putative rane protein precursor, partial [Devosia sp.]|nr:putative rane protein precursor [Devosia sp.]
MSIVRVATPLPASPTRGEVSSGGRSTIEPRRRLAPPALWGRLEGGWQRALALSLTILTLLFALPASAREAITSFSSAVTLNADGSVDVIETIEVNAEGYEIRRGIYRDIPLVLINPDNSRLRSDLTVKTVLRDGRTEPYSLDNIGAGFKRIRIGDADVLLSYGRHKYTIHYSMTRMGRSFADHDELFWNATGNYWNFPIDQAVTSITLPKGAVIDRLVGYTGAPGSMEQAVTITRTSDNTA